MAVTTESTTSSTTAAIWAERDQWVPRGISTYTHIVADHAHGAEIWDVEGKRYIDFAGGIGTLNAGHTPESVVAAIQDQAAKLIHTCFSVAIYVSYVELAKRLALMLPGDFPKKTMLSNSGAEAVENAVKIARFATGRPNTIAFYNAFHGRTLMGLSLTGKDKPYKDGFGPFPAQVVHTEFPYSYRCPVETCVHNGGSQDCPIESGEMLEDLLSTEVPASTVAAIIVEPVQGEGGFVVAPERFMHKLREICDREGILLIADEVQTGFGRTGTMFAMEQYGVAPDMTVVAKSLGAGLPISAVVGRAEIMDAPGPGGIGGTYGGNPVACRAALAVLDLFQRQNLVARAQKIGATCVRRFEEMRGRYELIGEVRGLGAMTAVELVYDRTSKEPAREATAEIIHRCHDAGLIVIKAGLFDNVIRVLAPFAITDAQLMEGLEILETQIATVQSSSAGSR
jgi:4-aminobutyrate aminotransferase / (S)-3-amino-2-methylpropionate transaminase / 5-aminovalerate transaminase